MAATTTYIHIRNNDRLAVDTAEGDVRVRLADQGVIFLPVDQARSLAAQLLVAAEHLDPVDDAAVARTLALATEVPA